MAQRVIWSHHAELSLRKISEYIGIDSPRYAVSFAHRILAEANRLRQFPELGAVVTEWNDPNKRELIVGNYRILYETRDESVLIIAIVHAARDISQGIPD